MSDPMTVVHLVTGAMALASGASLYRAARSGADLATLEQGGGDLSDIPADMAELLSRLDQEPGTRWGADRQQS